MDTLGRNQGHLLAGRKHLRNPVSDVIEECAQRTQTLIPSLDVIVAVDFQMLKKTPSLFEGEIDRKSTRLNSSHLVISYAVFCFKKKKKKTITTCADQVRGITTS